MNQIERHKSPRFQWDAFWCGAFLSFVLFMQLYEWSGKMKP